MCYSKSVRVPPVLVYVQVELGHSQVRTWYQYPLETCLAGQNGKAKTALKSEPIEPSLHDMDRVSIQSIYEFAPHLAEKPAPPRLPRPINPRDLEIYPLHTGEKKTIRELSERFELSDTRVWGDRHENAEASASGFVARLPPADVHSFCSSGGLRRRKLRKSSRS